VVQPNGDIDVVASVTDPGTGNSDIGVLQYQANGTLDTGFGAGGEVTTQYPSPIGTGVDSTYTVLVQPDGDILTGGGVQSTACNPKRNPNCTTDVVLTRYASNGTLDTTFGKGGFAERAVGSFGITAVSEDSAGDIFVQNGIGGTQPTLGEYSPAGVPDSRVTFSSSSSITVSSANGFQPNGTYAVGQSIVTGTGTGSPKQAQVVIKSLPSGAVDPNFNNPPFDYTTGDTNTVNIVQAIAFQSNGDVVAAGMQCPTGRNGCSSNTQTGVARLTSTGSLDTAFGNGGATTIGSGEEVTALAIQSNGDILIASLESSGSEISRVLG
jgi:uncharacterized delta-60 repeat protein